MAERTRGIKQQRSEGGMKAESARCAGESGGREKRSTGKVALKSEKICLVVLWQYHSNVDTHHTLHTTHTHTHIRGVTLFSITCDSCCPPDPCSYCGNGDRNYGGADGWVRGEWGKGEKGVEMGREGQGRSEEADAGQKLFEKLDSNLDFPKIMHLSNRRLDYGHD